MVGLLAALPSLLGIVTMQAVAASFDRRHERKWHMIGATAVSGRTVALPFVGRKHALPSSCV